MSACVLIVLFSFFRKVRFARPKAKCRTKNPAFLVSAATNAVPHLDRNLIGNEKFQAPSTKYQTNNNSQTPKRPNNGQNFGPAAGVCRLVHWTLLFVIWCL
jgi:hypothetical protein